MSNQTLHYYEKKHILRPKRDILSNYRYYDISDLKRLGSLKKYRNAEFSIEESQALCMESEANIMAKYQEKQRELVRQIERQQVVEQVLNQQIQEYEIFINDGTKLNLVHKSPVYIFKSEDQEILEKEAHIQKEGTPWFENLFLTQAVKIYQIDKFNNHQFDYDYGVMAEQKIVNYLKLPMTQNIKYIGEGFCLESIHRIHDESDYGKLLEDCLNQINQDKLILRDHPYMITLIPYKNNENKYELLVKLVIPVKKPQ